MSDAKVSSNVLSRLRERLECGAPSAGLREDLELAIAEIERLCKGHETRPEAPTPHHVQYDTVGWLCSICGGWNREAFTACSHKHASEQKAEPTQHQHWCRSNEFHGLAKDRECNCGAVNGKPPQ